MRHCVDDLEPGQTFTVLLDGEYVSDRCFGFDTDEQWVDCHKVGDNGNILIDYEVYETLRERLYGDVVVYLDPFDDKTGKKAHSRWVKWFFDAKEYFKRVGAKL